MANKGVLAGKSIIHDFGITKPDEYPLEDLIAGIKGPIVKYTKIDGAEGRIVNGEKYSVISINSGITNEGKRRFTLAHELGHFLMHKDIKFINDPEDNFWDWNNYQRIETEANYFAAELLMPEQIFFPLSRRTAFSVDSLKKLSAEFNTSFLSTAIRYAEIGNDPILIICTKEGEIKWFKKNNNFPFIEIGARNKIPSGTATFDYNKTGDLEGCAVEVDPNNWKIKAGKESGLIFMETVVPFLQYGYILTFISITQ